MYSGFITPKHDINNIGIPQSGIGSFIDPRLGPELSAYLYAHGIRVKQSDGLDGIYGYHPYISAAMVPPGGTSATGWTHHFFAAKAYQGDAHAMGYPGESVQRFVVSGRWSGYPRP